MAASTSLNFRPSLFSSISATVAVMPASAFSLIRPWACSSSSARPSLVASFGREMVISVLASAGSSAASSFTSSTASLTSSTASSAVSLTSSAAPSTASSAASFTSSAASPTVSAVSSTVSAASSTAPSTASTASSTFWGALNTPVAHSTARTITTTAAIAPISTFLFFMIFSSSFVPLRIQYANYIQSLPSCQLLTFLSPALDFCLSRVYALTVTIKRLFNC